MAAESRGMEDARFVRFTHDDGRVCYYATYTAYDPRNAAGWSHAIAVTLLRVGYLKAFMDGTLGSQTAWMLDGSGVRITSGTPT